MKSDATIHEVLLNSEIHGVEKVQEHLHRYIEEGFLREVVRHPEMTHDMLVQVIDRAQSASVVALEHPSLREEYLIAHWEKHKHNIEHTMNFLANPNTPVSILNEVILVENPTDDAVQYASKHPHLTETLWKKLAECNTGIIARSDCPPHLLEQQKLAPPYYALMNPNITIDLVREVFEHASTPHSASMTGRKILKLLNNPCITAKMFEIAYKSALTTSNKALVLQVAQHKLATPKIQAEIVSKLLGDSLEFPGLDPAVRTERSKTGSIDDVINLLNNTELTKDEIRIIFNRISCGDLSTIATENIRATRVSNGVSILELFICHENTPSDILLTLIDKVKGTTRETFVCNLRDVRVFIKLATRENWIPDEYYMLAKNPYIPLSLLPLMQDQVQIALDRPRFRANPAYVSKFIALIQELREEDERTENVKRIEQ